MAKESAVAQLAAKPIGTQVAILCGVLVVLGGLYYQLSYSTGEEDLKSAEAGYKSEVKKQKALKQREADWKQLLKDKKQLDESISSNQVSLPKAADLNSFVDHLQGQAAVAGVSFKSWSRNNEIAAGTYVKVPIAVQVVGNFHQILKYFHLLGEKETTARIITVEDFSLTPDTNTESDAVLLKASFRATAFRQADGAAVFVAPKKKAATDEKKKSGIDKVKEAREKREADVKKSVDADTEKKTPSAETPEGAAPTAPSGVDRIKNPGAQL